MFFVFVLFFTIFTVFLSSPLDQSIGLSFLRINQNKLEKIISGKLNLTIEECISLDKNYNRLNSIQFVVLNICIGNGIGVIQNNTKAFDNFQISADQGNSYSQFILGKYYWHGAIVNKNNTKAFELYEKSANQENSYGQFLLGDCYLFGNGVDRNLLKALENYKKSSDQGNLRGKYRQRELIRSEDKKKTIENYTAVKSNITHQLSVNKSSNCQKPILSQKKVKFCSQCGLNFIPKDKFCEDCGHIRSNKRII